MTPCNITRHDRYPPSLCGAPATIPVRVGCLHEHIQEGSVCQRCFDFARDDPTETWCTLCPVDRCCEIRVVRRDLTAVTPGPVLDL